MPPYFGVGDENSKSDLNVFIGGVKKYQFNKDQGVYQNMWIKKVATGCR
ncbi:hypothetical protein HDEF_1698 [Candidatus Hamiltonella defensa 5AT (Acyrthosiphon pisum)]|uniref:Uncharacterized protein n=1 Tax=Hamiltonella defensa subsp. Acyrthosiphon pisum (strain 5AT) TaxID=572265 RepID=C4K6W2_HAMD5|nr:hypothetical protein HDEF_1698 [Candidatus Hamiltonella defensa 5AT (Acyrthosiphon pisum)]